MELSNHNMCNHGTTNDIHSHGHASSTGYGMTGEEAPQTLNDIHSFSTLAHAAPWSGYCSHGNQILLGGVREGGMAANCPTKAQIF